METPNSLKLESERKGGQMKKEILRYFIDNGNATIQELSRETGLSVPTITKALGELIDLEYVNEHGKQDRGEGRRPILYGLNPLSGYFVGVELHADHVDMGMMDFRGDIVAADDNVAYDMSSTIDSVDTLCRLVEEFMARTGVQRDKVLGVSLCISGRVNSSSGYSHTFLNVTEQPLTKLLSARLGLPVGIENDTRAFAYGEYIKGCVKGEKNILFVNLSKGIGLGMVIDGHLYRGKSGFAGEIGHMHVYDNELLCHCGKKGCLETEVSGDALVRKIRERIEGGESSMLSRWYGDDFTLGNVIDAVNDEDTLCIDALEEMGERLGVWLANLINLFNPEMVIIGGSLANTGDFLLQPVRSSIRKHSLSLANRDTTLCLSRLKERGGVLGACLLARKSLLG